MDQEVVGEEALPAGLRRAHQQAGPDRMGRADQKRSLQAIQRAYRLTEHRTPELVMAVDDE